MIGCVLKIRYIFETNYYRSRETWPSNVIGNSVFFNCCGNGYGAFGIQISCSPRHQGITISHDGNDINFNSRIEENCNQ